MKMVSAERRTNEPAAPTRRRRWRNLVAVGLTAVAAAVGILIWDTAAEHRLRDALAETDRLEPGWRTGELEAARAVIPDEENSAPHVLAVHQALPPDMEFEVAARPCTIRPTPGMAINERLDEASLGALRANLNAAERARDLARALTDRSRGRYQPTPMTGPIPSPPSYPPPVGWVQQHCSNDPAYVVDNVTRLLIAEALLYSEEGDSEAALASCRRAINTARSWGDTLERQWHRTRTIGQALPLVEQLVAGGEPSEPALAALQRLLEDEAAHRPLLIMLRAMRARANEVAEQDLNIPNVWKGDPPPAAPIINRLVRARVKGRLADELQFYGRLIQIAKLPTEEQQPLYSDTQHDAFGALRALFPRDANDRLGLRSAITLLALERFRRAQHRWPDSLAELVPAYLSTVPGNPNDGNQLPYRRVADGVEIGTFRLWDVEQRRLLPGTALRR